jgi:glycosyltransferase involved in cell wall biosynthesis
MIKSYCIPLILTKNRTIDSIMANFSIIICTYNPEIRIIKRCLSAIQKLEENGFSYEVIIVENNCSAPLSNADELNEILKKFDKLKIIAEPLPGLSNARIAGVHSAGSPWLVFFDDDNEPDSDYLVSLLPLVSKYPNVGIWGPGNVTVDFVDKTTKWIDENCRDTFQEKHFTDIEYAMQEAWNRCYPPGSGICIRRDVFLKYIELYKSRNFKTTGRTGASLISAEDNQIINTSILLGFAVGTCPDLKLNHLIPAVKSNFSYIKRLRFFIRYSVPLAQVEFFPEQMQKYKDEQRSQLSLFTQLTKYLITGFFKGKLKEAMINCILISGNFTGINLVLNKRNPYWLILFLNCIGIKLK